MPTYVYRFVETGETIEVEQNFTDDTLQSYPHPDTGDEMAVKKVFQPVGVTFKGSGFYKTDSRSTKSNKKSATSDSSGGDSASSTKSDSATSSTDTSSTSKSDSGSASTKSTSGSTTKSAS